MDQIANMIIAIKNASKVKHKEITVPYSKLKEAILVCLKREGFISDFGKKIAPGGREVLSVSLAYNGERPRVAEAKRVSKPSRRMYMGVKEIFPVRNGTGVMILSTPKGILSGREARKEQVGGEILFTLW